MRQISLRVGIVVAVTALVAVVSLFAYGYVWGFDNPSATAGTEATSPLLTAAPTTTSTRATTTTAPATTTTRPAMQNPTPMAMPAVPPNGLGIGASGPTVLAFEQRLASLHFDPGPVDGRYDLDTMYSVQTVQKLWSLPRTGRIDDSTRYVISHFKYPTPLAPNGPGDRVEIDLDKQTLVVWQQYKIRLITTTSTGGGYYFCGGDSGCQYAVTPPGVYHFQRYHSGWDHGKLGELYNPYYFNGGIAVHGYPEVPAYAASHGCSRIPMHIANYFATLVYKGMEVDVVGKAASPPPGFVPPPPTTSTTAPAVTTTAPKSTTTRPHPTTTTPTTLPVTTTTH